MTCSINQKSPLSIGSPTTASQTSGQQEQVTGYKTLITRLKARKQ
ncbi:MAG: hypothetical protein ABIH69_05250 [bacterium]